MTGEEAQKAGRLVSDHNTLKYMIARYWESSGLGLHLVDDDYRTSSASIGGDLGYGLLIVARAQVEAKLRAMGVEPDTRMDGECFECCGSGRRKLGGE